MRIGITFSPEAPLWSSGANQTALLLAELFSTFHEIVLVNRTHSETEWFTDYEKPSYLTVSSLTHTSGLDWLIDIDGTIREEDRKRISAYTIVFLRTFLQFAEMDASVYMDYPYVGRSMVGVHEIWCWDLLNPEETIPSIQTLFPCPIRRVPFIWSPSFLKERSPGYPSSEWIVHVAEKNNNSSSSIIPLVAIRELTKTHHVEATYQIHNMDTIKEYRFLKDNILANIEADTLPLIFLSKEPWHKWSQNSIMLSHSRFIPLRPSLLQLLWLGIPLVHNSPVLSELHPQLKNMYYPGNDIKKLCSVMKGFMAHSEPWFAACNEIRDRIVSRFGLVANRERWSAILDTWVKPVEKVKNIEKPEEIIIAFSDMWPGFNYDSNFIMDALRHEAPALSIKGIPYSPSIPPSLVICGPYSTFWKNISSVPKVYFSAENWEVPNDPSISLYITSSTNEDSTHLRIPTWMTFINWFTTSSELPHGCTDNPIRLSVQLALQPHPIPFDKREQFCAFVVSNPTCAIRNEAFHHVNSYKKVNSGGALYNNIGGQLELKYPGGGCGDLSKYAFFSKHQFTLSFENSQAPGYITEKVLHAKMAGCVPLYWGTQTDSDFVPNSFINLSSIQSAEQVVEVLKKLEARPDLCAAIAATPILNEPRKQKALRMMSAMSQKILSLLGMKSLDRIDRINKTFVINLDSRPDRWESLLKAEPQLQGLVTRVPAVHGKSLSMSSSIFNLCKNNPFQWKKSIIGCYLSHLSVWKRILEEEGNLFLILEDDVRFQKGWMEQWKMAVQEMPEDAELMYWGGVLPPNKKVLPLVSETVNEQWARIRPNTMFSTASLPLFHFCAYSYLLTKAGAQKLIQYVESLDGMPFPGCDHILGHASLKTYFTSPLLTTCFQEEDPVYVHSQFDNLHREDTFDSDIWNNKECFSIDELAPFYKPNMTVYYMTDTEPYELYEKLWLEDMFQCDIECVPYSSTLFSALPEGAWIILQRPFISVWNTLLSTHQRPFHILHLSDEFEMDDISLYSHPYCKGVIRNYPRTDVPDAPHLITIPLGYHHRCAVKKSMEERPWVWSFHGTNWFQRGEQLKVFQAYEPHSCHLQPEWNHSSGTPSREYVEILGNSQFCPILKGNHMETFRLYEALEAGTLPLFGPTISSSYLEWIKQYVDVSTIYDWTSMESMTMSLEKKEQARVEIERQWANWKKTIQKSCRILLNRV